MRYDKERDIISVDVDEIIRLARRGMPGILPSDDDTAPGRPSATLRRAALGEEDPTPLTYTLPLSEYSFDISGRADALGDGLVTVLYPTASSPDKPSREETELSRGRAFILGYIYALTAGYDTVGLRVIYANERSGEICTSIEQVGISSLKKFFDKCASALTKYAQPEIERVTVRMPGMKAMKFPFSAVRDGQSELVRATYRTLAKGERLYACAPTGTGKTVSVLYPALKLYGEGKLDKVFYLTPKGTTAVVAGECIELLASGGTAIRAVILSSKERACTEELVCRKRASLCRHSSPTHLSDATLALYSEGLTVATVKEIKEVARRFSVCPYELELCYSELCDAVICDVNYLFDPRVYLRRYFDEGGRYGFLIDEAHNLAERAHEMYSAELCPDEIKEILASPFVSPVSRLAKEMPPLLIKLKAVLFPYVRDELRMDKDGREVGATHLSELPAELYGVIDEMLAITDSELKAAYAAKDEDADNRIFLLRELHYGIKRARDTAELFDEGYRLFIFYNNGQMKAQLYAIDTGRILDMMLSRGRGAVFFSATLSPLDYYKSVLGGTRSSTTMEVSSPFAPESLSVSIMDKISTRYSERERTLPAVSRAIAAAISPRRGSYMVFAPSFEYLEGLARDFTKKYPKIRVLTQRRDMTAREKADFLAEFERGGDSYLVGFCVMGGIYSEGIDLVGKRLIGAVVVGIGIPSLSYEREAIAEYYEERYEAGKQFAYIYPGMNRVLQAAGRVIRHESDRGIIVLIDDRFDDPIYKKSIPALWRGMEYVGDAKELNERIKDFWQEVDKENEIK